jgi:hypothetical protein
LSSLGLAQVTVLVSGERVSFPGTGPIIRHGRVMIPLRSVFEKLGATVTWYPSRAMAMVERGPLVTRLWVGQQIANVNQEEKTLDVAPVNVRGTILVPLRFISETYGAGVDWNQGTHTVSITPPADK